MAPKQEETSWLIEPLGKKHDRAAFSCGHDSLDIYIKAQASQDARRRAAAPFVALAPGSHIVQGYYTLSSVSIELIDIPQDTAKKLPRYPVVPATLLGRLAVDRSTQGSGLGQHLLVDALFRCHSHSRGIASAAIVVHPIDEKAKSFYEHFGFMPLSGGKPRMFLPMATVTRLRAD